MRKFSLRILKRHKNVVASKRLLFAPKIQPSLISPAPNSKSKMPVPLTANRRKRNNKQTSINKSIKTNKKIVERVNLIQLNLIQLIFYIEKRRLIVK
jgi:hypothetical protein